MWPVITPSSKGADPMSDETAASAAAPTPVLQVVKGEPTPEELAALVAVVSARAAAAATASASAANEPERASDWASYWRSVRRPLLHGPGEWRASGLPRC
jgi:Acyl-CoA carboxylase epsilon subunit